MKNTHSRWMSIYFAAEKNFGGKKNGQKKDRKKAEKKIVIVAILPFWFVCCCVISSAAMLPSYSSHLLSFQCSRYDIRTNLQFCCVFSSCHFAS